jgi:hypothetical protein
MACKRLRVLWLAAAFVLLNALAASAAIEVLDAAYRPDRELPQFAAFWKDWYNWGDAYVPYQASGALAVYIRNTGSGSVTINDMTINGTGLADGIKCNTSKTYKEGCDLYPCSVYYPSVKQVLVDAGEPIWWRVEPNPIPPGGTAEVFVRMRIRVLTTLSLVVQSSAGNVSTSIAVTSAAAPRVAGCDLSPDLTRLYLYLRHPQKGKVPTQVFVDGVDKTTSCTMVGDGACEITPVVCNLGVPLGRGTFHCVRAVYDDGSNAVDGLRMYYDEFKYGRWGGPPCSDLDDQRAHLIDMGVHSMNLQVNGWGAMGDIPKTSEGRAIMDQYGIKKAIQDPSGADRVYAIFLCDEIDAGDSNVPTSIVPATIGALAQDMSNRAQDFKDSYAQYPTMLNLAANYKPYNHHIYGHVPDVLSVDPYYQSRLSDAYWKKPNLQALYSKATYIYAVASSCMAGCEPRRLHVILSCARDYSDTYGVFRWATPEEKRIEVYYALAAGAKEVDYWWFTAAAANEGVGDADEPGSAALWREMGLLGAEAGMVSSLLVNGCPAEMPITKPGKLWTRALICGVDTLLLLCVNDDYASTEAGTMVRPINNADVSLDLPDWISPAGVFEVDYRGVRDVPYDVASGQINLHLGEVGLTRMLVITGDSTLKSTLQSRYTNTYGPRVSQLIPMP